MKTKIIALFLAVIAFVFGLCFLNEGLFHFDTVVLAQALEKTYATHILQPAVQGRYGSVIVNLLVYFPFYLAGQNADFALRLSSILFQALSISVLFLLINELLQDEFTALITALLFMVTPFYFIPNTYGKEHGLSMFVFLLSLYLLRKGIAKKSPILLSTSSFLIIFTITIREAMIITIPLYLFLYFQPEISPASWHVVVARERLSTRWLCAVFAPLVIMGAVILRLYLGELIINSFSVASSGYCKFSGLFSRVLGYAFEDLGYATPLFLLYVLSIFGIIMIILKKGIFLFLFFISWFSLILFFGNTSCYNSRCLDMVIIPVYVFSSYVLSALHKRKKLIAITLVFFTSIYMYSKMLPLLVYRHMYNGQKHFALFVKEKTEPNAIIIACDDGPFIEYYGKREVVGAPQDNQEQVNKVVDKISLYLKKAVPVYLVGAAFRYDLKKLFRNSLNSRFLHLEVGRALTEDYHFPELQLHIYPQQLFKIEQKR